MVTPASGSVVLIPFPFSDLSQTKLRPALVVVGVGRNDWILCQITSKPYDDDRALELTDADFHTGSLRVVSYVRPGKLFTANQDLMVHEVGRLQDERFREIVEAIVALLSTGLPAPEKPSLP